MGDLEQDTRVEGGDGRYVATLDEDWNIWGPNGGYLAAVLLRAAGAHAQVPRPATLSVQFLARAEFGPVDIEATTLRRTRRAEAVQVTMTQDGRTVAIALVWLVAGGLAGLEHDVTRMPDVPSADALRSWDQLVVENDIPPPPFRFWDNIEHWPVTWEDEWPPPGPLPPLSVTWFRFRPCAVFADQLVDAARLVVVLDTMGWPAATMAHAWDWPPDSPTWIAPSLDLSVRFHCFAPRSERLLVRMEAPLGAHGLITTEGRAWAEDGTLLASAASQLLCTPVPPS
ncbi:MAG: thioesterase family protein [Acidimicrobiales bacterium]|nr:thioesterase family protein [Acidimicrobiales bacterium]